MSNVCHILGPQRPSKSIGTVSVSVPNLTVLDCVSLTSKELNFKLTACIFDYGLLPQVHLV